MIKLILPLVVTLSLLFPTSGIAGKKADAERQEQFNLIIKSSPLYNDPALQDYVANVGQKLAKLSNTRKELRFHVVDNQVVNAFALEHGDIFITRGMLAYLQNEAQLAAVLGHEIGHITKKHHSRGKGAGRSAKALSTIAAILVYYQTGSSSSAGSIQSAGDLLGAEAVTGFGRDRELESDEVGAELLVKGGYDVQALVDVMSILKDQERFAKVKQKETGQKASGYHGLFASHPRNDKRLLNLIKVAGVDNARGRTDIDDKKFRDITEGIRFSDQNLQSTVIKSRYYNRNLNFTTQFPEGWKVKSKGSVIQAKANKDGAIIQLKAKKADPLLTPQQYLEQTLNVTGFVYPETFEGENLKGFTGLKPGSGAKASLRWAVIYYMGAAYVFTAQTTNKALESAYDSQFVSSIKSFRPLTQEDLSLALASSVQYIQATEGITFEELAKDSPLKKYAEEELRLLNGHYPSGEPETGDWIKVIQ